MTLPAAAEGERGRLRPLIRHLFRGAMLNQGADAPRSPIGTAMSRVPHRATVLVADDEP